jgi:N-acetylneuraminic acid mutarotase
MNTWSSEAPMPGGRYQSSGAGVISGLLYVAGGWTMSPPLPSSSLLVYNPAMNAWSSATAMPQLSGCGQSGAIGGKLYTTTPCNGFSGYQAILQAYDPVANSWANLAQSPNGHSGGATGVIGGELYVVGGIEAQPPYALVPSLDVYNPATGTWSTKAPMPTNRQLAAAGVINGKLYVAGGTDDNGTYFSKVEVYDPGSDTWSTAESMPTARYGAVGAVVGGALYVVGRSAGGPRSPRSRR